MTVARLSQPSSVGTYVMSPHQRASSPVRSGWKSRGDEVGTEGSLGIGDRGRVPSSAVPASQPGGPDQPCNTTTAAPGTLAHEHGMHARGAVGSA